MFYFGKKSLENLEGVHEHLVKVVHDALIRSDVDFMVFEGLRTKERQRELLARGASRTLHSRHLTGHAVDLVPYVNGGPRWDWPLCYLIAKAVKDACIEFQVPIVWGGVWDRELSRLGTDLEYEVALYVQRVKHMNPYAEAFTDGPHFELSRVHYPG